MLPPRPKSVLVHQLHPLILEAFLSNLNLDVGVSPSAHDNGHDSQMLASCFGCVLGFVLLTQLLL